jgi:predicted DNA-binding transcriptional regulator AlpA
MTTPTEYLTADEAAELLQINTFSLYRMVRGKYGPPATHVGRALRFSRFSPRPVGRRRWYTGAVMTVVATV